MRVHITVLFFFYSYNLVAQDFRPAYVDSLKQVIDTTNNDSLKVGYYTDICGEFYFYNSDSILHYASKIAALEEKNDSKYFLAIYDTEVGTAYWEKAQYDKAIFHYRRGLDFRKSMDGYEQDMIIGDLSYNLGICYTDIGNYESALEVLHEAIEYFERGRNDQWVAHSTNAIGDVYVKLEKFDRAIDKYKEALAILPAAYKGLFDEGLFLCNLANGMLRSGAIDSSKVYVERGITIYKEEEMNWGMAFAHGILSKIALEEKDYTSARSNAELSLDFSTEQGSPAEMAEAYVLMGEAGMHSGDMDYALENLLEGDRLAKQHNLPLIKLNAKHLIASVYEKKGDEKKAYLYLKEYTSIKDSLISLENNVESSHTTMEYDALRQNLDNANQALKSAHEKMDRNNFYSGIGFAILALLFLFNRYKLRRRSGG